jgi:pimeloyl-ACP methyl ester carboxylesterase
VTSAGAARSAPATSTPTIALSTTIRQHDGHDARVVVYAAPDARRRARPAFLTLGGPVYCGQILPLATSMGASLLCADYWQNRYTGPGLRSQRFMDWGDPQYDAAVAKLPERVRRAGIRISKLIVVGVSYTGFATAELVATHPDLRPAALIIVDSYLDLPARFQAAKPWRETRQEIATVLGGTLAERPAAYEARSPSHHLDGLAKAIRGGMRLVDVWSVDPEERKRYVGATCSRTSNAEWLSKLAMRLRRPVDGYVTQLEHAEALWHHYASLLAFAGLTRNSGDSLAVRRFRFRPGAPLSAASYCADQLHRSHDGILYGQP